MTVEEYLELFYPFLFDAAGSRFVPEVDRAKYILVAASRRPTCLSDEEQNEAQAHYAAYLMLRTKAWTASESGGMVASPGSVVREKQGNVEVQYGEGGGSSSSDTAFNAWHGMWRVCGVGGILVSDAFCGSGGAPP